MADILRSETLSDMHRAAAMSASVPPISEADFGSVVLDPVATPLETVARFPQSSPQSQMGRDGSEPSHSLGARLIDWLIGRLARDPEGAFAQALTRRERCSQMRICNATSGPVAAAEMARLIRVEALRVPARRPAAPVPSVPGSTPK